MAIGAAAIAAPILISVRLAWRQSVSYEETRVAGYTMDALRRSDETGEQILRAYREVGGSGFAPCSKQEIDLMRQIDVSSTYLQAVGRISGDTLTCTSLGTTQPIPIGPPTLKLDSGSENRLNVRLDISDNQPITIVSRNGIAVLIDPSLPMDTAMEGPDVSMSLFVPSSQPVRVIGSHGTIRPEWYRVVGKGSSVTFEDGGYVVSLARSKIGDIAVLAAAPADYVARRVKRFATIFVPIGVLCGLALAWAVVYISQMRLSMPALLRGAVKRREFFVEYQPVVDLASGRWVGVEALVRWKRTGQVERPEIFIPVAEASGMVTLITQCVTEIVAADVPQMQRIDSKFRVAINLSASDLRSSDTLELLKQMAAAAGTQMDSLVVEIPERGFLQGAESQDLLHEMRTLGIKVAIDGFGTGLSGLSRLQTMELDALKIDKSFVDTIDTDGATSQVVPHIIQMGHSLHLDMVAEGVETVAQAEFLRQRGVGYGQGKLFADPMPLRILCAALTAQRGREQELARTGD